MAARNDDTGSDRGPAPDARERVLAELEVLLEAERAGARATMPRATDPGTDAGRELIARVHRDEVHWCGVLMAAIRHLGGEPGSRTGDFYDKVITTHTHADRVDTISQVRQAGIKVCSGGILGLGESRRNRAAMVAQLANLNPAPDSVPINNLVAIPGTPLAEEDKVDNFEFLRTIAAARIAMPKSVVRLSAGREAMTEEMQALCFLAGANSIFAGDKLLTTPNPDVNDDMKMFELLGLKPQKPFTKVTQPATVEAEDSQFQSLGEKPKWTRPEHKIERNLEASGKGK